MKDSDGNKASTSMRARLARLRPVHARLQELRYRIEALEKARRRQRSTARETGVKLADLERRLIALSATMAGLKKKYAPFERASDLRALEHGRFSLQIGAIEERIGRLEQTLTNGRLVEGVEDAPEARSLLDQVQREHEQIRVRMQIISSYEERLRRVEATADSLYDGDPRHQV